MRGRPIVRTNACGHLEVEIEQGYLRLSQRPGYGGLDDGGSIR